MDVRAAGSPRHLPYLTGSDATSRREGVGPSERTTAIRHDWTLAEVRELHDTPLLSLVFQAQAIHRQFHTADEVELATLLSIKTGACPEDCSYCPQSGRYDTHVKAEKLMTVDEVVSAATRAKEAGATRFCMGAAWREARQGPSFEAVLEMVRGVKKLGLESCVTLGMLNDEQAQRLKEAGLDTYNHNIDTSREFYKSIITTREFEDRLATIGRVRSHGISVCCGGIIGMGESIDDRCRMLIELSSQKPHPESVPINTLVPVEGTPLASLPPVPPLELVRMIATARIMMPKSRVRLSAGRSRLSQEAQVLCFMAGANSMFYGEQLLTTPNPEANEDRDLLTAAGLKARTL